jgi:hypothetical protein
MQSSSGSCCFAIGKKLKAVHLCIEQRRRPAAAEILQRCLAKYAREIVAVFVVPQPAP